MNVYDFCFLYLEDSEEMEIWSNKKQRTVYSGTFCGAMYSDFSAEEVQSFGIENGKICINVD